MPAILFPTAILPRFRAKWIPLGPGKRVNTTRRKPVWRQKACPETDAARGDPSPLGRGGTDYVTALIEALRRRGVVRIEGRVVGDDNQAEEPRPGLAWSWDDLGTPSGAML